MNDSVSQGLTPLDPVNPELEARIAAEPDDETAWQIYADWLNEQGCPRGELAAVHLAYAKKALPSLRLKADALLEKYPALTSRELDKVEWKAGFWQRITVDFHHDVVAHPSARLCQRMTMTTSDEDHSPIVAALVECGPFPALRRLTIGADPEYGQSDYDSYLDIRRCRGLAQLPSATPHLRMLSLVLLEDFDFGAFANLETLTILSVTPRPESIRALCEVELPRLRRLKLVLGTMNGDATDQPLRADDFAALGKHMPKLSKLELHAVANVETLAHDVATLLAPLAKRLKSCVIDDAVAT